MFRPVLKAKSGGSVAAGPVVEVEIGTFLSFQESGTWTAADARDHLAANNAPYAFDQVYADLLLIGGGGPGKVHWNYANGIFGGFPGSVVRRRVLLSDLLPAADSELSTMIGNGGGKWDYEGGMTAITTYDAEWNTVFHLEAVGGSAGTDVEELNDPNRGLASQSALHDKAALLGYRGHDLSKFALSAGFIQIPNPVGGGNVDGPGIGGFVFPYTESPGVYSPNRNGGGNSNCLSRSLRLGGVAETDVTPPYTQKDGQDSDPAVFDSFGAGGGVGEYKPTEPHFSGIGGRGGRGGGGGGACFFDGTQEEFQDVAWLLEPGNGGNGEVRIRLSILRSAS